ncbi:MAG: restriction endonuclease subunit S [Sediminibacterium sp.]|jgi:type I restriction enzyme, S subunit|uniref:restriction endonuclease subunit S n=1 Tax=Sediminibacterium sp. TaxID=1917865 RepID=UPI002ABCCB5F|nr:restriction endonuclease subunit S [Sediminibacterium sp.]MDZ4070783.1 restriction endonuclease subunit S [Sediminibacterium sp.]
MRMSKDNKDKILPRLRFPEFMKDTVWNADKLGVIGEPLMCKRIFKEETTNNSSNGVPFYKIGTFGGLADSFISEETYKKYKIKYAFPKIGEILISASGTIGRLVVYDGSPAYFQDSNIVWIGNDETLMLNKFLFYCYSTLKWQTSDGGVISRLYNSDLRNMKIHFPQSKKEQQKIAACLSSLDDIITAETQKLEILQAHKKGLLQNLFPAEGETVPRLRFQEFEDNGEWEDTSLGEIGNFTGGGTPSRDIESFWTGDIPWISSSDIDEESIHLIKISRFISNEALQKSATKLVPVNSILLVSRVGVGKLAVSKNQICTSQDFTSFTPQKSDVFFIAYYLKSKTSVLIGYSQGMAIKGFTKDDISKFCIYLPSITEQQKIASSLSSLDEMILSQKQKVGFLKLHKKGLLQGLFPNTSEINT